MQAHGTSIRHRSIFSVVSELLRREYLRSCEMDSKPPITDSPWFWVLLFSGMALGALVAMGPKYGGRQSRLELQYQARERIAAERARLSTDGSASRDINAADRVGGESRADERGERRALASPGATLIPLWPLGAVLVLVMLGSVAMLLREYRRSRGQAGAILEHGDA